MDNDPLQDLMSRLADLERADEKCFLCGKSITEGAYTEEHVVPAWAQRRHDLWNQTISLPNGTSIQYRHLRVPCCEVCNKEHLKPIEDDVASATELGRDAVLAIAPRRLFLWLGKIYWGILYRELTLLAERSDPASGTIVTPDWLRDYHPHRFLLQEARGVVRLLDFEPGTVFVFDAQPLSNPALEWDFCDSVHAPFASVRVGKVAIFAGLGDGGALELVREDYRDIEDLPLHPLQFRELTARLVDAALRCTRTPKYVTFSGKPHTTIQMPLGGYSTKPIIGPVDTKTYAQILSFYTDIPIDGLYEPPYSIRTWLRTPAGMPNFMPVSVYGEGWR